jgi:hypothetical protein
MKGVPEIQISAIIIVKFIFYWIIQILFGTFLDHMNTSKIQRNTLQNSAQFDMCAVTSFFSNISVLSISGTGKMMYAESQITFLKNTSTAVQVLWCGKYQDVSTVPAATCFLILNNVSAGLHAENTSPALFWLGHSSADNCINPG